MTGFAAFLPWGLAPLETHLLPGWEPVSDPSPLQFFLVLIVIPAIIAAILITLVTARHAARNNPVSILGVDEPKTPDTPAIGGAGRPRPWIIAGGSSAAALTTGPEQRSELVAAAADGVAVETVPVAEHSVH